MLLRGQMMAPAGFLIPSPLRALRPLSSVCDAVAVGSRRIFSRALVQPKLDDPGFA